MCTGTTKAWLGGLGELALASSSSNAKILTGSFNSTSGIGTGTTSDPVIINCGFIPMLFICTFDSTEGFQPAENGYWYHSFIWFYDSGESLYTTSKGGSGSPRTAVFTVNGNTLTISGINYDIVTNNCTFKYIILGI